MIRELLPNDYDEVLKLDYQIHEIHLKNRPDIYNDENPLPHGYFNRIINSGYNYVYEINGKIVGLIIGVGEIFGGGVAPILVLLMKVLIFLFIRKEKSYLLTI